MATSAAHCHRKVRQWRANKYRLRWSHNWESKGIWTKEKGEYVSETVAAFSFERGNAVKMVTRLRDRAQRVAQLYSSVEQ